MTSGGYDRTFWEELWARTLERHPDKVASRPPNVHLVAELGGLAPGRALDAGCGHGAETLWLAAHGWHVTALDFSSSALAHGRATAEALGHDIAERIVWVEGDLAEDRDGPPAPSARPPAAALAAPGGDYDLVLCLYVHVAGSVHEMVQRMARGVAPGGTLFMVGHRPVDPVTGAPTAAAGQVQVSVADATAALDPRTWELLVAEERPRAVAGSGVDAVIRARRRL